MKQTKKEAACLQQTAEKTKRQGKLYWSSSSKASGKLKLQLGNLLLYLQRPLEQSQRSRLQQTFETMLKEFINQKYLMVQL